MNQVRFVQMIIKKELNVSGRKKNDIIKDLKSKNFKSFPKVVKKEDTEIVEEGNEEEQEEVETGSDNGYDYLLSVQTPHNIPANFADADLLAHQ
jgi:DNA topoisomerase II